MAFHLDPASRHLLSISTDGSFLGVVREMTMTISLFRADRIVSPANRSFPGHREIIMDDSCFRAGYIGFSLKKKRGKLCAFYRNSALNSEKPMNCLGIDEMEDIIKAMDVELADEFACFPERGSMTTQQARATLSNADADFALVVEAAAIVCHSTESTPEDLLSCLDHAGLPAEFGAMELYRRTGRSIPKDPLQIIVDRSEWENLLSVNSSAVSQKH